MNAQTNHPINNTTDPQFLGPEAGQQANGKAEGTASGEEQSLSEREANGTELHRYFSIARAALISVRSNGVTLRRQVDDDWKALSRKTAEYSLAQWVANKKATFNALSDWQREVEELPSMQELKEWDADGVCETPTGHRVEPDGTGPDGVPSWLRVLRLI